MMKKMIATVSVFIGSLLASAVATRAHCPLCTAAIGGGLVITRLYGVDDMIVGLWIGALVISTAVWFNRSLKKRYIPAQEQLIAVLSLLLTVVPFYFAGLFEGIHQMFGVDKLLLGMLAGSLLSYAVFAASSEIKRKRKQPLFKFQTLALVIAALLAASLAAWLLVR